MAEINLVTSGKSSKAKVRRHLIRMDMTPMVDLGFLLITFFIFNSVMATPTAMKLMMPADGSSTPIAQSKTLSVLLGADGKALCYESFAKNNTGVKEVNLNKGQPVFRDILQRKMASLLNRGMPQTELMVIIKPSLQSNYNTLVTALDEMTINGVKKYAIAELDDDDRKLLADTH